MSTFFDRLPPVRGKLLANEQLAPFTWFRVGGPAQVLFTPEASGVNVRVCFDAETVYPVEQQQQGWQAILDNFARHVEARA